MNDQTNRTLLLILIFIGIILIVLVAAGQRPLARFGGLTASVSPLDTYQKQPAQVGTYSIVRYIPQKQSVAPQTSYSYTSYQPQYYPTDTSIMFPDGCTMTSPYSLTTGLPCS